MIKPNDDVLIYGSVVRKVKYVTEDSVILINDTKVNVNSLEKVYKINGKFYTETQLNDLHNKVTLVLQKILEDKLNESN